jgi:hypothetical protein
MRQSRRRRALLTGAVLAVACVAAVPAQAATAKAGSGHYGTWIQTSWNIDGRTLPCPVSLGLPAPAPSISCAANTFLTLKKNGRYVSNMPVFRSNDADKGVYAVVDLDAGKRDVIVFDDDGAVDSPRAYRVQVLQPAGASKTLIISLVMSTPGGGQSKFKMLFAPKAG